MSEREGTEPTKIEKRWFARLKRVIEDMPPDVEIMVHSSSIDLVRPAAIEAAFVEDGHVDATEALDWFQTRRVRPCSESL